MEKAILFKILQRRFKYRNPDNLTDIPSSLVYSRDEYLSAKEYISQLQELQISFCHPEDPLYPDDFRRMKEPPLFFEYQGAPVWRDSAFMAVVGSREISPLTEKWMKHQLPPFLQSSKAGIVSGGARGVDRLAHQIAIKCEAPTIVVLPSGLKNLYPRNLCDMRPLLSDGKLCLFSEFEIDEELRKSHFFFRNRSIAAFGKTTLVAQAEIKSGSLLTVHHALDIGKQVLTIPSHPELPGFGGNLFLLGDGAVSIKNSQALTDFWEAEVWAN
jgi:DNA processing protein